MPDLSKPSKVSLGKPAPAPASSVTRESPEHRDTAIENPAPVESRSAAAPPRDQESKSGSKSRAVIVAVVAGVLLVGSLSWALSTAIGSNRESDRTTAPSSPGDEPAIADDLVSGDTEADAEADAENANPNTVSEPEDGVQCSDIYSTSMARTLEQLGLQLNPTWSQNQGFFRFAAESTRVSLSEFGHVRCAWLPPSGSTGVGIDTRIAVVSAEEGRVVQARLSSLGYSTLSELGSIRYFFETPASGSTPASGESHIVVGGYWFATRWVGTGPYGYTADMVTSIAR